MRLLSRSISRLIFISVLIAACGRSDPTATTDGGHDTESSDATAKHEEIFDLSEYDFKCADNVLGMEITDQIFPEICGNRCRTPMQDELDKMESCHADYVVVEDIGEIAQDEKMVESISGSDKNESGTGKNESTSVATYVDDIEFDPKSYDLECVDSVLSQEITDQLFPDICGDRCRNIFKEELDMLESCRVDPEALPDEGGIHAHIVRQVIAPTALPEGMMAAVLKSVKLPESLRVVSQTDECEIFEGDECAEIQWEAVNELRAGEYTAIQISPSNPDIIYAGIDSNDMSLYQSKDGGDTWKLVHITGHTSGVAISPTDPNVVVYTILEGPMERTTDGGLTWNSVDIGGVEVQRLDPTQEGANIFTAVAFAPDNGNIAYTSTVSGMHRSGTDGGPIDFFVSKNGGENWELAGVCETCGGAKMLAVQPGDSGVIWAATNNGVQVSRDSGKSWSGNLIGDYTRHGEILGVALRPGEPDTVLAAGAEAGMFRSTDGGETWEPANSGLGTRLLHQVTFANSNSDVAYVATHEGIYRSNDAGMSWMERNNGLQYRFTTPIAVDPRDEDVVFAGSASEVYTTHPNHFNPGLHEGEGLYKSVDGGLNWFRSDEGVDEAKLVQMATHPLLPFNLWADGESGRGAFFTPDAGQNWLFSPNHAAHYPMVFAFTSTLPTEIYLTSWMNDGELMTSKDGGHNWIDLAPEVAAGVSDDTKALGLYDETKRRWLHLHGLAVSESNPDVIYVGSVHDTVYADVEFNLKGAHIFKSVDGGETFVEMSNGFPIETRTSINVMLIHPKEPDIAYAMTSLHETETAIGIYKTMDGGKNWTAINNGLDLYTNDLQIDSTAYDTLYAATESGIYKTTDGGEVWKRSSNGIPDDMPVIDLAIDPINSLVLYAITPDHVYRSKNGGNDWYTIDFGLPLLTDAEIESAQPERPYPYDLARSNIAKTGHSEYGRTFAQDRSLEIDATGRVIYVVVKTKASDKYGPEYHKIRRLYRAILLPLMTVEYQFQLEGKSIIVESTSHVYGMAYDQKLREIRFTAAGPIGTEGVTTINIPGDILGGPYTVEVGEVVVSKASDDVSITFKYDHEGRSQVVIGGK